MDIFSMMRTEADPVKAEKMSAYMRNLFPFLGIQTPERRRLSRSFFRSMKNRPMEWDFPFKCWDQPEREFQYLAMDYLSALSSALSPTDIPHLRTLAVTKSWWDTIDGIDLIIGSIALRHPEVNETLLAWSLDDNFWLRRIAIDHQLTRKEKTNAALLEQIIINNLGHKEFFVNKAIGWSLRNYSKTNPDWVKNFLEKYGDRMSPPQQKRGGQVPLICRPRGDHLPGLKVYPRVE